MHPKDGQNEDVHMNNYQHTLQFVDDLGDRYDFYYHLPDSGIPHLSITIHFRDQERVHKQLGYKVSAQSFSIPVLDDQLKWRYYPRSHNDCESIMSPESVEFIERAHKMKVFG